jgi:hypothetical protein
MDYVQPLFSASNKRGNRVDVLSVFENMEKALYIFGILIRFSLSLFAFISQEKVFNVYSTAYMTHDTHVAMIYT